MNQTSRASTPSNLDPEVSGQSTPGVAGSTAESPQLPKWSVGSWKSRPSKSTAVAEVARESISADQTKPQHPHQAKAQSSQTPPSPRLSERFRTPSKASPTTKLSVSSNVTEQSPLAAESKASTKEGDHGGSDLKTEQEGKGKIEEPAQEPAKDRPLPATGWGGWWSRPKAADTEGEIMGKEDKNTSKAVQEAKGNSVRMDANEGRSTAKNASSKEDTTDATNQYSQNKSGDVDNARQQQRASWFGLWGSPATAETASSSQKSSVVEPLASNVASDGYATLDENHPLESGNKAQSKPPGSWAFWSKSGLKEEEESKVKKDAQGEFGQLAIANTSSESNPKTAEMSSEQAKQNLDPAASKKRGRPASIQAAEKAAEEKRQKSAPPRAESKSAETNAISSVESSTLNTGISYGVDNKTVKKKTEKLPEPENLLLPSLRRTFHVTESPSYWQQISRLFGGRPASSDNRHLSILPSPPKVQRALAIGVHGYFPSPIVSRVLGQPTGTSIRFANGAAAAIQKWCDKNGMQCGVEKIALEGEGTIESRVETLWKLLLNWIDQIRKADFLLIACHSQGVPVAMALLARLINFGCISPHARLGVCAMAGVNLGPFSSYSPGSRLLGSGMAAHELFEFGRPQSTVSVNYRTALETCLTHHVRILFVGSIDDQLVSLESSLLTTVSHPYIYRAVFVDGRIHAPSFISTLVGLACKLRNLGVSDHGLIRELSSPLAGSLYTGEGHSRIYEDTAVYELAVEHALETSPVASGLAIEVKEYEAPTATNTNPFFLPWALRGMLEEQFVRTELKDETDELLRLFEAWKPASKVLRDVKFRLEAVRTNL